MRGQLALHGIDTRVACSTWLDAVYAIVATAPMEVLKALDQQLLIASARIAPDRETWGLLPEHQRAMRGLVTPDAEIPPPPGRRP